MVDVSIAVVTYDSARFLDRCLRSCLNQLTNHLSIEIVVVDDGSTDDTQDVLSSFGAALKVKKLPANLGVGAASAEALSLARGEYFMRVDADDFLSQFALEFLVSVARANRFASFVFSDFYEVDERGFKGKASKQLTVDSILTHGAGILMLKEAIERVGGYSRELRDCEDYDLLARVLLDDQIGIRIPVPLYRYRKHDQNLTGLSTRTHNLTEMEKRYAGIHNRSGQILF